MLTQPIIEVIDANIHIFKQLKKNKQKKVLFITILKKKMGVLANIFGILVSKSDKKRAANSDCSKYERISNIRSYHAPCRGNT